MEAAYRIVRNHFREWNARCNAIKDKNGDLLIENEDKEKRWKEYLEELYSGNNLCKSVIEEENEVEEDDKGAPILRSEFDAAFRDLRTNKASGIYDNPAEVIKKAGESL